jgi:hypothetical protein
MTTTIDTETRAIDRTAPESGEGTTFAARYCGFSGPDEPNAENGVNLVKLS